MRIKLFTIVAIIYFFFDSAGLPHGLRYTLIFAPIVFINVYPKYSKTFWSLGLAILLFGGVHLINGIENYFEYFKSLTLHFLVFVLCIGFYSKLTDSPSLVANTIERITVINWIFIIVALIFLLFKFPAYEILWREYKLTSFPQLRLLTYEPSYYCLMLVPLFFYFYSRLRKRIKKKDLYMLSSIVIGLLLSRSVGVVAGIVLSIIISTLNFSPKVKFERFIRTLSFFFVILVLTVFIQVFFPDNYFSMRLLSFIQGKDVSGMARIFDPWILGVNILEKKSYLFGVGWGHVKIYGHDLIIDFYNYKDRNQRVDLPNTVAESFVILGIIGLLIRLGFQWYLYKKTQVKDSIYRQYLFWFVFVYQFTGSFSTNLVEYVIWILAFTRTSYFDKSIVGENGLRRDEDTN